MMQCLPNEIILIIFDNIFKLTDKRQFLKTCTLYNSLTKILFKQYEDNFNVKNFNKINNYCVEKFTLELCHDKYFDMIPISYINPQNKVLIQALATFNCTQLLQIAKDNGCYLHSVYSHAATNGHLDILKWAHDQGISVRASKKHGNPWNKDICTIAASNGHLEILKWAALSDLGASAEAREHKCIWGIQTTFYAASHGHLDVLKWAIGNGCKFSLKDCSTIARINKRTHVLEWLTKNYQ